MSVHPRRAVKAVAIQEIRVCIYKTGRTLTNEKVNICFTSVTPYYSRTGQKAE